MTDPAPASADPSIIARRTAQLQAARSNFRDIPREAVMGYPVPLFQDGELWLGYLFFLRKGRPPARPELTMPGWIARIDLRSGEKIEYSTLTENDLQHVLGPHILPEEMDMKAFNAAREELYTSLSILLPLAQFPEKHLTPEMEAASSRFVTLWEEIAHKPIRAYYRALNPAFFDRLGITE